MGKFAGTISEVFPTEQPPLDPFSEARMRNADPDTAAAAQQLSTETGLDSAVIARNLPEVQARQQIGKFQQFLRDTPGPRRGDDVFAQRQ